MTGNEEIKKIYSLANLKIDESELEEIAKKFDEVFQFANEIMDIDTKDIEELEIVVEHNSPLRADEVCESVSREDALYNANDREYGYFKLKKVVK